MPRNAQFRRWSLRAGLSASLVIAAVWACSYRWSLVRSDPRPQPRLHQLLFSKGTVHVSVVPTMRPPPPAPPAAPVSRYTSITAGSGQVTVDGAVATSAPIPARRRPMPEMEVAWSLVKTPRDAVARGWPRRTRTVLYDNTVIHTVSIPAWVFLACAATPTTWLWWRARPRAGRCAECRYDLTGLIPGSPCPECGQTSESEA